MKLKNLFIALLIINTIAIMFVILMISEYQASNKQLESAYQMQYRSLVLADELRQSSDDLTRMARTYVLTGNEMFKKQFQMVLDIRNGKIPRPKNYNQIYWDFLTLDGSKPILDGLQIPLKELMKQAGFPETELSLLLLSQKESDDLTNLETKAMNAMIGIFQDKNGNYTIKDQPNYKLAQEIMHSDEYHKAKIAIMQPLDQFYQAFDQRTKRKIEEANKVVKDFESYLGITILAFLILIFFSFFIILLRIIHPLELLNKTMLLLAKNEMDTSIPQHEYQDEVGEMIGAVEIFKQNAINLISSEQKNKLLLDSVGEGIFGLDSKGRFTFLNPMACTLLGYKSNELIGKKFVSTIAVLKDEQTLTKKEKLMLNTSNEVLFKKKDNVTFPVDFVATAIYEKEFIIGSVVVFSDITKRKEYEEKLKKASHKAKRANHSKTVFLTNMSHELRTPLNAILGFTSLLENSNNLSIKEKENIKIIKSSGKHLLGMINEILELSKIEAGKIEIIPNHFDLFVMLDQIYQMFLARCEEKLLKFEIRKSSKVPQYIYCDEHRLRQILINLLGNAVKFTQDGLIIVELDGDSGNLLFNVKDTGIGIEEKNLEKIFQPFEQVSNLYSKNGTGLGLAITKELVNNMGGAIEVKSTINQGSEFKFCIKYQESTQDKITLAENFIDIKKYQSIENYTALVVDDIEENRKLIVEILKSLGIKTIEADDGMSAIESLKKTYINICFMDLRMKNMDGIEAIKKIRELQYEFPIIVVSANVFEDDKNNAYKAGANEFLAKPILHNDIIKTLDKFIEIKPISIIEPTHALKNTTITNEQLKNIYDASLQLNAKTIKDILEEFDEADELRQIILDYLHKFDFLNLAKYLEKKI